MTAPDTELLTAREAFARGDWRTARQKLRSSGRDRSLAPADLELLSRACWLLGEVPESMEQTEQAFTGYLRVGDPVAAAGLAIRLGLEWSTRGDVAISSAWLARARRLLRDQPATPVTGYLDYVEASLVLEIDGDPGVVESAAGRVADLADRFADPALGCFALVLRGVAAIRSGRTVEGFGHLDEAMLPVLASQVDPLWAGDIYCSVIHLCEGLADLTRMRAWTDALDRWAKPLSALFLYAGVTRVHQLQLIAAEGDWDVVETELGVRSRALIGAHGWLAGAGYVELGDVRRLRGDLSGARGLYRRARALGVDPQPGEAELLRTAGRPAEALAALRAAIGERGRLERARLLLPAVELAIETAELADAEALTAELEETARHFGSPGLRARAHQAHATLAIVTGRAAEALPHLEAAAQVYREQRFRYAIARVHEQMADAHRALGNSSAAAAALATARAIYGQLGAVPDVRRLEGTGGSGPPGGLTAREAEVLAGVAAGSSNREVAERLVISDKTVGRHLANIFAKLGVSSRTAAAAWAHEHGIGGTRPH
jgi:DNA-binding NarL/FixJ family response regulator